MTEVTGVMIMKNGKAWGVAYQDGHSTSYGWIEPEHAPIHNPKYINNPEDVTCKGSSYVLELKTDEIVKVKRTTILEIIE